MDRDAQLLANRIALLKQEEMRTWKKIDETKKRATEVMRLKQRNAERVNQKLERMQIEEYNKQQRVLEHERHRKMNENERQKTQQAIIMQR